MNRIDFSQTGGFPYDESTLDFLQESTKLVSQICALAGPLAIVSGCVLASGNVSDGFVVINGEILPFVGAAIDINVIIHETPTNLVYQDGTQKTVVFNRYATFGVNPGNQYPWAGFVRNTPTGLISRIEAIEAAMQNSLIKLDSGTAVIGNIAAGGTIWPVVFNAPINTNYMILLTPIGYSGSPANDVVNCVEYRDKTANGFNLYITEPTGSVQSISIEWVAIAH